MMGYLHIKPKATNAAAPASEGATTASAK